MLSFYLLKKMFSAVLKKIAARMIMNWAGEEAVPILNLIQHLDFLTDSETSQKVSCLTIFISRLEVRSSAFFSSLKRY